MSEFIKAAAGTGVVAGIICEFSVCFRRADEGRVIAPWAVEMRPAGAEEADGWCAGRGDGVHEAGIVADE